MFILKYIAGVSRAGRTMPSQDSSRSRILKLENQITSIEY
jgi:hypothetical protein